MNNPLMWNETLIMLIVGTLSVLTVFNTIRALTGARKVNAWIPVLNERKQAFVLARRQASSGVPRWLKANRGCYPRLN